MGPLSFQAEQGYILANLELVKTIIKLGQFFFCSDGSHVIKEYLWILVPHRDNR